MSEMFEQVAPARPLPWTGERLTTEAGKQVHIEHLHRYLLARTLCRGLDVLDVASGEGYGSSLLAQTASSVVGIELDPVVVAHASEAYANARLRFEVGDARRLPLADASVDVVVSFETIEHFGEHALFLAEICRVLRSGGRLIISSPERDVYSPAGQPPNPYHVRELNQAEFTSLLAHSFRHVAMLGQRAILGSLLVTADGCRPVPTPTLTFERRSDRMFEASVGFPRPVYLLAVASDSPLQGVPDSFYFDSHLVEPPLMPSAAEDHLTPARASLVDASADTRQIELELASTRQELERVRLELSSCQKQLAGRDIGAEEHRIARVEAVWGGAPPSEAAIQWSTYPMGHPVVQAATNRRATGRIDQDAYERLRELMTGFGFQLPLTGVASLCCGAGSLERNLVQLGLLSRCVGFDLATGALDAARQAAATAGMPGLTYEMRDLEREGIGLTGLNLVLAHQGVHHISGLEAVFDAVHAALAPGGIFHLHEFVGPDRFQWSDRQIAEITEWLQSVPEHYRVTRTGLIKSQGGRATIEEMLAYDPSEAVRSSHIEPAVAARFEIVERRALGGTLAMMALADIAQNFDPASPEAVAHIERLLFREDELIASGELISDFVVLVARRQMS